VLQNLSERLEDDIKEMLISSGNREKAHKRSRQRRPLEKARRKVLKEQARQEELVEDRKVEIETERAQKKAKDLRSMRSSRRPSSANTSVDGEIDREDDDFIILESHLDSDGMKLKQERDRLEAEWERLRKEQKESQAREKQRAADQERLQERLQQQQHESQAREKQRAADQERLQERLWQQQEEMRVERLDLEQEKRRHQDDIKLWRESRDSEIERGFRRRWPEEVRRPSEENEMLRDQPLRSHHHETHKEPRRRSRKSISKGYKVSYSSPLQL
jgi:hypothetical protein